MTELTDVLVNSIESATAAASPNQLVRLAEHQAEKESIEALIQDLDDDLTPSKHDPVTLPGEDESITLSLTGQALSAEVRLPSETETQAAALAESESFGAPAAGDVVSLAKQKVSNVVVTYGVETAAVGVDYYLDAVAGKIIILNGALVGEGFTVEYDAAQILDGPALEITEDGLQVKLGTDHEDAARGDHTHDLLHNEATGLETNTANTSVNGKGQQVSVDVKLKGDGGLSSDSEGVFVDTTQIATKASVDDAVSDIADHESRLDALEAGVSITVADTESVDLTKSAGGQITAEVKLTTGLVEVLGQGVGVNFDEVAAKSITDDHEARIAAIEGNTLTPMALPIIIAITGENGSVVTETGAAAFRMIGNVRITEIRASLKTESSSGVVEVDVKKNGVSIFTTTLTIDQGGRTSVSATTPAVLDDAVAEISDDDEITFDVVDPGTGATGLKVALIGVNL